MVIKCDKLLFVCIFLDEDDQPVDTAKKRRLGTYILVIKLYRKVQIMK